jgi:hypothetical protein
MVKNIKSLLGYFGLLDKIITHVKDEGYNLQSLTTILTFVGFLFFAKVGYSFHMGFCFGRVMSKMFNKPWMNPRYIMD